MGKPSKQAKQDGTVGAEFVEIPAKAIGIAGFQPISGMNETEPKKPEEPEFDGKLLMLATEFKDALADATRGTWTAAKLATEIQTKLSLREFFTFM